MNCSSWNIFRKQCETNELFLREKLILNFDIQENNPVEGINNNMLMTKGEEYHDFESVDIEIRNKQIDSTIVYEGNAVLPFKNKENELNIDSQDESESEKEQVTPSKKKKKNAVEFFCQECNKSFRNAERFEAHERQHQGKKVHIKFYFILIKYLLSFYFSRKFVKYVVKNLII